MPRLILDGAHVSYTDEGRGEALVLIHGWIGSAALWDLLIPELSSRFRVLAPDLPGHGDSGVPEGFSFDLEGFSGFLDGFRQAVGLQRFTPVGHSMGGCIAAHYAAHYPQRVSSLVLMDTPTRVRSIAWPARFPFVERILGLIHRFWGPRIAAFTIRSSVRHPERLPPGWLERAVAQACKLDRRAFLGTTRMLRHLDLRAILSEIEVPALLIQGERDRSVNPAEAFLLRDALPRPSLRLIADCGHCPNYEYPQEVGAMVKEFLAASQPPPRTWIDSE